MAEIRIGISGWRYGPWRGAFYPRDLPQRLELWYAARILSAIEINGSFYSLQRPEHYAQWYADTPPGFVFAVKGGRFITHMKRLNDVAVPLANFFASGIFNLREKLGPILWQLPPTLRYERARLASFFELLPRDTSAALRLARRRDARLTGRARLAVDAHRPMRHALEVRHESFRDPDFIALLREHGIGLVIAETAKRWPLLQDVTADFVYLRLHGDKELYKSGYGPAALARWAVRIAAWRSGGQPADARLLAASSPNTRPRDVFCFFDNTDVKLRAPIDAQSLMRKLGLEPGTVEAQWRPARAPRSNQRRSVPMRDAG
jgi:uncharacterized protein YecE (DUF72 family)